MQEDDTSKAGGGGGAATSSWSGLGARVGGEGPKKVTYIFWVPHGDMLQFLPPRVPPNNISVAVHGGGAWKI